MGETPWKFESSRPHHFLNPFLADAEHKDYSEIKEWFGIYDPNVIDEAAIKTALSRIAKHRVCQQNT